MVSKQMKIAIISDTHDNLANLEKFLSFAKEEKIKAVFHCGDVTNTETLAYFVSKFPGEVFLCLGNADLKEEIIKNFSERKEERLKIFEGSGEVNLEDKKFIFSHFLESIENRLNDSDFAFFGHTHRPWLKNAKKPIILNPGNLAGLYYRATFAALDLKTGIPQLRIVEKI